MKSEEIEKLAYNITDQAGNELVVVDLEDVKKLLQQREEAEEKAFWAGTEVSKLENIEKAFQDYKSKQDEDTTPKNN